MKNALPQWIYKYSVCILFFFLVASIYSSQAQSLIWWVGGSSNNWSDGNNWSTVGSGSTTLAGRAPLSTEKVIFDGGGANGNTACTISGSAVTVTGITMNGSYTSTITLNANLMTQGTNVFSTGSVSGAYQLILSAPAATVTTFNSGFVADVQITGTTGSLFLNGATFNKIFSVIKNVNTTDNSNGGNTFLGDVSLENASSGNLVLANTNSDTFSGALTLKTSIANGTINVAYSGAGTTFTGSVILNYATPSSNIYFGANGGVSTFNSATPINISCGSGCGNLSLANATVVAATSLDLTPNGSTAATLTLGPNSNFSDALVAIAPSLVVNSIRCTGASASLIKTGASNDVSDGGNNFGNAVTPTVTSISNAGSGNLKLGNTTTDNFWGDVNIFNGSTYGTYTGTGSIYLNNNLFLGNINLNSPNTSLPLSKGIYFSNCGGCSSIQAAGKTISQGSAMVAGELALQNFTQNGSADISLPLHTINSTGNVVYLGPNSDFGGNVNITASRLFLNGATYRGTATLTKDGAGNDIGLGNNTFNSTTSITNQGDISTNTFVGQFGTNGNNAFNGAVTITNASRQYLNMSLTTGNTYNSTATFINSNSAGVGTAYIEVAYAGTTNFYGDVTVSNIMAGNGIYFGRGGGQAILNSGAAIKATAANFTTGFLTVQNFTQNSAGAANSVIISGTFQIGPTVDIYGSVDFRAPQLLLSGAKYRGTTYLEKTSAGATTDTGTGSNIFLGTTTIANSSNVGLQTNGNNNFNGTVASNGTTTTIQNTGAGFTSLEYSSGQTSNYWGATTITNSGATNSLIQVGLSGTTNFNDNISVNSTGASGSFGVYFGDNAAACVGVNLVDSKTITATTFNTGELRLKKFTQGTTGVNTPQNITLTLSGGLRVGPASTFNGDVTFSAPSVLLDGCNYKGPSNNSSITKTGATTDSGLGGNVFSTDIILVNSGTGVLATATTGGSFDSFSKKLTLNNSSSGAIRISDKVSGTTFGDNIIFNSTGSGGIYFGLNGGTSSLAEGKLLVNGNTVVNTDNGTIQFANFTQGSIVQGTAQSISFTSSGTAYALLTIGPFSKFYGNVTFTSPGIFLDESTYKGTATISKTGGNSEAGTGGNTFEMKSFLSNSGAGELRTGNSIKDVFKDDVTLTNTSSGDVSVAYNNGTSGNLATATEFQKNVFFNSTSGVSSGAAGVYIGLGGGAGATLAANSLLKVGASGVTGGKVFLGRLSQPAGVTDDQTLSFTSNNSTNPLLHIYSSYFRGGVTFTADRIRLDGSTFEGINVFTKTGSKTTTGIAGDDCAGGNTFTGGGAASSYSKTTTLNTTSNVNGYWAFSYPGGSPDTFNGPLIVNNGGSNVNTANINLAHDISGSTATAFNNTVTFNITNANPYITLGNSSGAGALFSDAGIVTTNGGQIIMSSVNGTLLLGKVDVYSDHSDLSGSGGSNKTITSGTGQLIIGSTATLNCHFRKGMSAKQLSVSVQYSTFDGNTTIEMTGSSTVNSSGGNTFGDASSDIITITNSGSGVFKLAFSTGDTFYGNTTFAQSGGLMRPCFNGTNKFYSDLTTSASNGTAITLSSSSGNTTFSGSTNQTIGITSSTLSPIFRKMVMNQGSGGQVTLGTDITISGAGSGSSSLTFTSGIIYPGTNNYTVNFASDATSSGASTPGPSTSFVAGRVQKTGNTAFTFPIGLVSGSLKTCRPLTITSISTSDSFTAQYFQSSPASFGTSLASTLDNLSNCEYWTLSNTGTASALVKLSWYSAECSSYSISNINDLRVSEWSGTTWQDLGGGSPTGTTSSGTVTATSSVSSFGQPFTLGSAVHATNLPIELKAFEVYAVENRLARLYWKTDSEINNRGFEIYKSVDGKEFYKIGFVDGNGTTNLLHEYSFNDRNLISRAYYKLRQLDNDGHSVYSEIRYLSTKGDQPKSLTVAPNPMETSAQIILQGINEQELVELEIFDRGGQVVKSYHGMSSEINKFFQVDVTNFTAGLYIIKAATSSGSLHCKFIKL